MRTWINAALRTGKLRVADSQPNDPMASGFVYEAVMSWEGESDIRAVGPSADEALDRLDHSLMEDCAEEMQRRGVV